MKRLFIISLLSAIFIFVSGCGNENDSPNVNNTIQPTSTKTYEEQIAEINKNGEEMLEDHAKLREILANPTSLAECETLVDDFNKRKCKYEIITAEAMSRTEKSLCLQLEYKEDQESCLQKVPEKYIDELDLTEQG